MAGIWVLMDEKIGTANQALGVALSLGLPFKKKEVKYNIFASLPNFLKINCIGIDNAQTLLNDEPPDLVISAGRRLVNFAVFLKKKYGAKIIHLMNFGSYLQNRFDLIITPSHDDLFKIPKNMVAVMGTPHILSDEILNQAKDKWQETFSKYRRPLLAVIIGGNNKSHKFTPDMARELTSLIRQKFKNCGLLITTSRRTGEGNEKIIFEGLKDMCPYIYDYKKGGDNPYHAFLALADKILVTGDSMSMCSEAVFTGKSVFIYAPENLVSKKHLRFHSELYQSGYAFPLNRDTDTQIITTGKRYDPNQKITEIIKSRGLI